MHSESPQHMLFSCVAQIECDDWPEELEICCVVLVLAAMLSRLCSRAEETRHRAAEAITAWAWAWVWVWLGSTHSPRARG